MKLFLSLAIIAAFATPVFANTGDISQTTTQVEQSKGKKKGKKKKKSKKRGDTGGDAPAPAPGGN